MTLEQVAETEDPASLLLPVDTCFSQYSALTLTEAEEERKVRNGNPISLDGSDGAYRVYGPGGAFLALSRLEQGRLVTIKSFFEV
jgi:tRNA pseudouridine55 synthase